MQDLSTPSLSPPSKRSRSGGITLSVALVAFLLGAALVTWIASRGYLAQVLPASQPAPAAPTSGAPQGGATASRTSSAMDAINTVEGRLALIEDRMSRVDFQSRAASGNAARAESLLIAFAARRQIDRGVALGTVADQLRLHFAQAQPRAVQTVIDFAQRPVTVDELSARLEALSGGLATNGANTSLWDRARHQLGSLFVVRSGTAELGTPSARIARARLMLGSGRIDQAIAEVERLPGANVADNWIADARRYGAVQQALDLLETTAMLEPNRLTDDSGQAVTQASPLAPTAPAGEPTEDAVAE
ncbi:hypothetical protein WSK_2114 [Novosphingobium sp. Rr 2-17]|uniref:mitofilin family membrane protein n=1 Tax=Novosphingobium sp. Rr 2-17 TaxID=555793 RepID=UPI0002698EC7|nr:mitofilin family membrane protein [Novosphingobium sp. Rr 2-17]EIZ79269.1 hypothetical protein WSK_2114 [Novosphingobium sp. Rr 2-17]